MPGPGAAARGAERGALPDGKAAKKDIAFDGTNATFRLDVFGTFLVPAPEESRTRSGGARGREGGTLPDGNAAKKDIALDGTNAISFWMRLVHFWSLGRKMPGAAARGGERGAL